MAKEIDKIIQSKTAPKNNNVLWDDGENLKINRNGKWESTGGGAPMINITYANLVELRNNNKLTAGMQYRIIDYETTTAQENTRSAGHQFDVIVTADNENTLNEVARTCLHDGDTYFSEHGAKLEAWQIWYSLDNNAERFAWADAENGKGVIYRMIDEWNNDCPYDFKNILFTRYELEAPEEYIAEGNDTLWMQQLCNNVRAMFDEGVRSFVWAGIADEDKYWENDMSQILSYTTGENFAFFTFNTDEDTDASLSGNIQDNKMQLSQTLPNNVFFGNSCYNNDFSKQCDSNTFGSGCAYNTFGTFCHRNTFGNGCTYNTFGTDCSDNSFRSSCRYNTFGYSCYYNSFGHGCYRNSFDNVCFSNSFGNQCYDNSFGENCYYNSFGTNCSSNSFGNNSQSNELKSYYRYITFGEGVHYVTLQNDSEGHEGNQVQNYKVANGTTNIEVDVDRNNSVEKYIGVNSAGEVKVFCLADLANS
jgi:hypothetical protein